MAPKGDSIMSFHPAHNHKKFNNFNGLTKITGCWHIACFSVDHRHCRCSKHSLVLSF
jgi:hypothetical protein